MRMILPGILLLSVTASVAEPHRGWLTGTGDDDDFLQFMCTEQRDGSRHCSFVQIMMSPKRDPATIEAVINEQLPGLMVQLPRACDDEFAYMRVISAFMEAVIAKDRAAAEDALAQLPAEIVNEFDFDAVSEGVAYKDQRELDDLRTTLAALARLCDEPNEEAIRAMQRLELEREARSCKLFINQWEDTFEPVS